MSAISSYPSAGPSTSYAELPTQSPPHLLDLFRTILSPHQCTNLPPCLSNEGLRDRFLVDHTTYEETLEYIFPNTPEKIETIQRQFIEAQIFLQLYNDEPQVFVPSFTPPIHTYRIAFRGSENKIRCFYWTPNKDTPQQSVFDSATLKTYTLSCSPFNTLESLYSHALEDYTEEKDQHRFKELTALLDKTATPPEPILWIPDQTVKSFGKSVPPIDFIAQASISGKNLPIQKFRSSKEISSLSFINTQILTALNTSDDDNDCNDKAAQLFLDKKFDSEELLNFLFEHTTYPQAFQLSLQNSITSHEEFLYLLKRIYFMATIFDQLKKETPETIEIDDFPHSAFLVYTNEQGKLDVIRWSGSLDDKNEHVLNLLLGKGRTCLAQTAESLSTGEKFVLKHIHRPMRDRYKSIIAPIFDQIHLLKMLHATYGEIKGLPSPPMIVIPPQASLSKGAIPLVGVIEKNYGTSLHTIRRRNLNRAQTLSLFKSFVDILELIYFFNHLQFPFQHLYHLDIKLDNIVVKIESDEVTLTLIDFGHTRQLKDILKGPIPPYAELYRQDLDYVELNKMIIQNNIEEVKTIMGARETYALGVCLGLLLDIYDRIEESKVKEFLEERAKANDLPENLDCEILALQRKMRRSNYKKRISLKDAIAELKRITM